jgi:hypothetical protein
LLFSPFAAQQIYRRWPAPQQQYRLFPARLASSAGGEYIGTSSATLFSALRVECPMARLIKPLKSASRRAMRGLSRFVAIAAASLPSAGV